MLNTSQIQAAIAKSIQEDAGGFFDWSAYFESHEWGIITLIVFIAIMSFVYLYSGDD